MGEREEVEALAKALSRVHFDGEGCGTYGINACSVCHGPSPMSAWEVAGEVLSSPWLAAHDERTRADERERLAGECEQFAHMLPIPQSRDALLAVASRLRLAQARCEDVAHGPGGVHERLAGEVEAG